MGCCGSKEEEVTAIDNVAADALAQEAEGGTAAALESNRINLTIEEAKAARPGDRTFIASVLKARELVPDNAEIMTDCCTRVQAYNRRLKEYVALYDCQVRPVAQRSPARTMVGPPRADACRVRAFFFRLFFRARTRLSTKQ